MINIFCFNLLFFSCKVSWEKNLTKDLTRNRLHWTTESRETINVNITSTLIELYRNVKESWIKDYYSEIDGNKVNFRRRSPFIPYALKNDTGSSLSFVTLISDLDNLKTITDYNANDSILVSPGETVPFSFKNRAKMRHYDSHTMKMHQLGVQVEGWQPLTPVTVDKVGIYFRTTYAQIQNRVKW